MTDIALAAFGLNAAAGLVANAVTSVVVQGIQNVKERTERAAQLKKQLASNESILAIIGKTAATVGKTLSGSAQHDRLREFLMSPEAETLLRQLTVLHAGRGTQETELTENLQHNFRAALTAFLPEAADLAYPLFKSLAAAVDRGIETAIANGALGVHEAQSTARFKLLSGELQSLRRAIEYLGKPTLNIDEVIKFEQQLRSAIAMRHCTIVPPHFDTAVKVPIDDIFVAPTLTMPSDRHGKTYDAELLDLLTGVSRLVILGNPGGGKSTLSTKICHELASNYKERLAAGRELTPFIVVLREYGAEHKEKAISILEHMESVVGAKYQLRPPPGALEYLLLSGRLLVIFDGLDELLDNSYRREVSANVESFANLYGNVPVIVTSREVGYEQAPLDPRIFTRCRLAPFNMNQVSEYATKWFALETDYTDAQKREKAAAFLRESESVADLRSNPLMLALLCNIYRGENYIPQNRPDVYEKCAVMLFEKWDPSRGIHVELPFQAHIRPALMFVARWIYGDERLQAGVSEAKIIEKTKEYLWPRRFEDSDEAVAAARDFVEFCRGRAWVFTDTGTSKTDDSLYQFTHRTFLEYFAAAYLVRTNETADALFNELAPRIAAREWDVVAQLAFQLKNKASEEAADRLITLLLDHATGQDSVSARNCISFAARSLGFLVPSPRITRQIVSTCIQFGVAARLKALTHEGLRKNHAASHIPKLNEDYEPEQLITPLLIVAQENRTVVLDEIERVLSAALRAGNNDLDRRAVYADLLFTLDWFLDEELLGDNLTAEVEAMVSRILMACNAEVLAIAPGILVVAIHLHWRGAVSLADIVRWHGFAAIFVQPTALYFGESWVSSIATSIVVRLIRIGSVSRDSTSDADDVILTLERDLEHVGSKAVSARRPWASRAVAQNMGTHLRIGRHHHRRSVPLSNQAMFGLLCLAAVFFESLEGEPNLPDVSAALPSAVPIICMARNTPKYKASAAAEIAKLNLPSEQRTFLEAWLERKLMLIS